MEPDKIALSFIASYAAIEMVFFLMGLVTAGGATRSLLQGVIPNLGIIFCIRLIMNTYYPVKSIVGGAKLSGLLTLFTVIVMCPGPLRTINGTIFAIVFSFNLLCAFGACIAVLFFFKQQFGR